MNKEEKLKTLGILFIEKFLKAGLSYKEKKRLFEVDIFELKMGIKVEFEHTSCPYISAKIALDHLTEIPDYYTRLAKMEKEAMEELGIHEESKTACLRKSNNRKGSNKNV